MEVTDDGSKNIRQCQCLVWLKHTETQRFVVPWCRSSTSATSWSWTVWHCTQLAWDTEVFSLKDIQRSTQSNSVACLTLQCECRYILCNCCTSISSISSPNAHGNQGITAYCNAQLVPRMDHSASQHGCLGIIRELGDIPLYFEHLWTRWKHSLLKLQHNCFRLLSVIPVWVRTCLHCKGQQLFGKFNALWELGTKYFVFKAEMMFRQEVFHESAFDILFQAAALVHCAQHLWRWLQSPRRLPRAFLDFEIVPKLWPCQSTLLEFVSWEDGLSCFVLQTVPELCDHLQEQADAEEPRDAVLGSLKSMDRTPEA